MKAKVMTLEAGTAGDVELNESVFGLTPRTDILQRMVVWQLARRRGGTRKIKTRGEIRGTSKKMHRQKGTGMARRGNKKANILRGGAKGHGPVVRDHGFALPAKLRTLALKHALSSKAGADELIVLDKAVMSEPKTAILRKNLTGLGVSDALIIDGGGVDQNFALASRNLAGVDVLPVQGINVYDILRRSRLVLTRAALEGLEARFG